MQAFLTFTEFLSGGGIRMDVRTWLVAGLAAATVGCAGPKTANSVLQDALAANGNVSALQFSGTGMSAFVGQAVMAGQEWPRRDLSSFTAAINYDQHSARYDLNFAQPTFGGQQQNTEVNGDRAWNTGPNGPTPQLAAAEARQIQILLTPLGFLKGAVAAGNATLAEAADGTSTISYSALGEYTLKGTIDAQNMVTKIETKRPDSVLGDADIVATFSDYKDYNGVKFPGKIVVTEGGFPSWELTVNSVTPNAQVDLPVPEVVQKATIQPTQVVTTKLGDGLWFLSGSSHHSLVVEFKDYIAVIEAPLNEERSMAVMAEARKLVPDKPIKYVLTTHHHFDHTGGLRTYVAEGATVLTHQSNVAYFQKAMAAPATVVPDMQAKSPKTPVIQGVSEKYVLTDGTQTIEMYPTDGDTHTGEYLLIYLPKQRVLVEADAFSPGPPDAPPPATPPPNAVKLNSMIQSLKLDVATLAPIHGRGPVPVAELKKFIGA
jgi:glyoxylase-like metal-dependent hydrolase (beta-lactamase superfamily II)